MRPLPTLKALAVILVMLFSAAVTERSPAETTVWSSLLYPVTWVMFSLSIEAFTPVFRTSAATEASSDVMLASLEPATL